MGNQRSHSLSKGHRIGLGAALSAPLAALAFGFSAAAAAEFGVRTDSAPAANTIKAGSPIIENQYSIKLDDPLLPLAAIGALGGAALIVFGYGQRRRLKIAIPYMLAGGVAVTLLLNPEIVTEPHEKLPTEVIVAVDKSASQSLVPGRLEATDAMKAEITRALQGLGNVNIRIVDVGSAPGNAPTKVFSAIRDIPDLNPGNVGGVFVLSDGQIGDVPKISPFPDGTPVHALISGKAGEFDRTIRLEEAPRYGTLGEEQVFKVVAEDVGEGAKPGQPVTLTLKQEGGEAVSVETLTGEPTEVKVKINHAGPNVLTIEASALEGELSTANNRIVTSIQGNRESVNVLVLSGTVSDTAPMLRNIIKSDPRSNLIHTMMLRLPEDVNDQIKSGEMNLRQVDLRQLRQNLPKFDLIVFDRYPNWNVIPAPYMKSIADYVKGGGAVLVLAGSEFTGRTSLIRTPLKDVLPVMPGPGSVESEASPMASEAGQKHPILKGLPGVNAKPGDDASWGPWDHTTEAALKSGTAILQTPDGKPLLVLDKPGKGRSAILLSESLPLWTDGYKGGGPSEKLISQVAHWLMQNPDLEEEALNVKLTQDGEKLRIERRSMAEAVDPVILQGPDGKDISVSLTQAEPGLWSAEIPVGGNGVYQVRQDGAAEGQQSLIAFTHKGPANLKELQQAVSTDALIKPLANATGGRTERMAGLKTPRIEFGEYAQGDILHIRENQKTEVKGREDMPLIHPLLGGFLIAAFAAWGWVREGDPKRIQALKDALWRRKDKPAPQGPDADGGVA